MYANDVNYNNRRGKDENLKQRIQIVRFKIQQIINSSIANVNLTISMIIVVFLKWGCYSWTSIYVLFIENYKEE